MEDRFPAWYSIISYSPNYIRYEKLNIGIIMGVKNELKLNFLEARNKKLSSLLWSRTERDEYKSSMSLLKFLVSDISKHNSKIVPPSLNNGSWNSFFAVDTLPYGLDFSDANYAMVTNSDDLMRKLIDIYIGNQFFNKKDVSSLKKSVYSYFDKKQTLANKLRKNIKIAPVKTIASMRIEMDYVYLHNSTNKPRFIQTVPNNSEKSLYNWYKNVSVLSNRNDNFEKLHLIIGSQSSKSYLTETLQMIDDLKVSDNSRIESINFDYENDDTTSLEQLAHSIEVNALDISNWKNYPDLAI